MKKMLLIGLMIATSTSWANDFESELKLPEAHFNPKTGETVVQVEVSTDKYIQEDQAEIIKNIEDRVGSEKLIIVEKTISEE